MTQYPNAPGFKNIKVETGMAAARASAGSANVIREKVMRYFGNKDGTAHECAAAIRPANMSDVQFENFKHSVQSRVSELKAQGKIMILTARRSNSSGHKAVVWGRHRKSVQAEMAMG